MWNEKTIENERKERTNMDKYMVVFHDNETKYLGIYRHIKKLIEEGTLKGNEKLPTLRSLSQKLSVNMATCVSAYKLLEKEHLIYKVTGSGSYVMPEAQEIYEKKGGIRLDIGHPNAEIFPLNEFRHSIEKALQVGIREIFDYQDGLGYEPLREEIVKYMQTLGIQSDKKNVQIISGAQQGISLVAKALLNYGDIIYLEQPSYHGAMEVFADMKVKVVGIPMLQDGIDIGLLQLKLRKFRPKLMYLMPNYQNPTGITYSVKKKEMLLKLAREYDFYIIEDDFLSDISFRGNQEHRPLKSYDKEHRVIYIKSFSKIMMPGLRIGFIDMPIQFVEALCKEKSKMDIATPNLIQQSLYLYFKDYNWSRHIQQVQRNYIEKFDTAMEILKKEFKGKAEYIVPAGGTNIFMFLPKDRHSTEFKQFLLDNYDISILEGNLFSDSFHYNNGFRVSYASLNEEEIKQAFLRLKMGMSEFLKE